MTKASYSKQGYRPFLDLPGIDQVHDRGVKENIMGKGYIVFRCGKCGHMRKSSIPIYKDYGYNFEPYQRTPEMIATRSKAQFDPCPRCGNRPLTYHGWA
jgi:predicted RNA-binding Zn-ribbon protein involved in translation (DUF1610 family)